MSVEDAKNELKKILAKKGWKLRDEHETDLFYELGDLMVGIHEHDLQNYSEYMDIRESMENRPYPTCICTKDHREQMVRGIGGGHRTPAEFILGRQPIVFRNRDDEPSVQIGEASSTFMNFFRFKSEFEEFHFRGARSLLPREPDLKEDKKIGMRTIAFEDLYRKPITIAVHRIDKTTVDKAIEESDKLIHSCIFQLSYLKNIVIRVAEFFPSYRLGRESGERSWQRPERGREFQLPPTYDENIVHYYQLGASAESPVLGFLGFYQVLEYFFHTVTDEKVRFYVACQVSDPKFKNNPKKIAKMISEIRDYHKTDETKMLSNVIEKYVTEDELTEFLSTVEKETGSTQYTTERQLFGEKVRIDKSRGNVIPTVSKTLKIVRNALVHSSAEEEGIGSHIPFTESEEIVKSEIPLVRFLASKVVIGSGVRQ